MAEREPHIKNQVTSEQSFLRKPGFQRLISIIVIGMIIATIISSMTEGTNPDHNPIHDYILSILLTFSIWEGNIRIDHWMNRLLPWQEVPGKRFVIQGLINLVFSALIIYLAMLVYDRLVCELSEGVRSKMHFSSIVLGCMLSTIILSIDIGSQFYHKWKESIKEAERFKAESLQAQLQNLKNQINPHFLFNNLNVLNALIYKDPNEASAFISELARVYRYSLESRNNDLVTLKEELSFIESYAFLMEIRFGDALHIVLTLDDTHLNFLVPPMGLQLLIENAIQHNEISKERPLTVTIHSEKNGITVVNNLQLRTHPEASNGIGLNNLKQRYAHFTDQQLVIEKTETQFRVYIPLLTAST